MVIKEMERIKGLCLLEWSLEVPGRKLHLGWSDCVYMANSRKRVGLICRDLPKYVSSKPSRDLLLCALLPCFLLQSKLYEVPHQEIQT